MTIIIIIIDALWLNYDHHLYFHFQHHNHCHDTHHQDQQAGDNLEGDVLQEKPCAVGRVWLGTGRERERGTTEIIIIIMIVIIMIMMIMMMIMVIMKMIIHCSWSSPVQKRARKMLIGRVSFYFQACLCLKHSLLAWEAPRWPLWQWQHWWERWQWWQH